ncbi:DUF6257 family protein [Streptomyces agglomeratus]|uniref:DUF6257 family protein n=1 Tax=Streptomyces agglomeratus TaxID=285458 RepID=UPI00159EF601|nr:DUF6257 family protein [Streptomyces agglomeratus]
MAQNPPLTAGEAARIAWLAARMCKRDLAGEGVHQGDLERKVERILDGAQKRADKGK